VENGHLKAACPQSSRTLATDNAVKLANALRAALEKTAIAKN
jgi:hypothetical protein